MIHSKFWQAFFALAPIIIFVLAFFGYMFFLFSILGNLHGIRSMPTDLPWNS